MSGSIYNKYDCNGTYFMLYALEGLTLLVTLGLYDFELLTKVNNMIACVWKFFFFVLSASL
jgi:hypothetical protein